MSSAVRSNSFRVCAHLCMPITLREAVRAFEDAPQVDYSLCSHGLPCGRCGSRGEVGCRLFHVEISLPTTVYRALEAASKCGLFDGNKFFNYGVDSRDSFMRVRGYESWAEVLGNDCMPF